MGTTANDVVVTNYLDALLSITGDRTKIFDEKCSNWAPQPDYNRVFLRANQMYANDILSSRGHLFLNEVYDMLGMPRTRVGALVGWIHPSSVDFEAVEKDNVFILTFNINGVIWDLI